MSRNGKRPMAAITLVLPHQLFDPHPAISRDRPVCMIEDSLFFGDRYASPGIGRYHQQKIVLHRASMKTFEARLETQGYSVVYREYDQEKVLGDHLEDLLTESGFETFHFCDPSDFLLSKRLNRFAESREGVSLCEHESPMFLTPKDWMEDHFSSRKKPFMAKFYEAQRLRMGILIDSDGKPEGGRWSFDDENRKSMPKAGLNVPPDPTANRTNYVVEAIEYTKRLFPDAPGAAELFAYPVSHDSAQRWLDNFLVERFATFGPYEDAISHRERVLFHSVLTPMLNIGLLTPQQVVDQALACAADREIPIASLEGFIRQLIGWREFMRAMYDRHGVEMRTGNFFEHTQKVPAAFYDGTTGIDPVDDAIRRALNHGYCHHIERLMVLGNFMLLCQFDPASVNDWFMELFVDAYDWVMVPNVYGMSQFADGGIFTTKPYVSGSNYIKKMSDYGKGDWCDTWDGLFWSFIALHGDFFRSQYRLAMMAKNLDRMSAEKIASHQRNAEEFLQQVC